MQGVCHRDRTLAYIVQYFLYITRVLRLKVLFLSIFSSFKRLEPLMQAAPAARLSHKDRLSLN
jgi:hypothetical protein